MKIIELKTENKIILRNLLPNKLLTQLVTLSSKIFIQQKKTENILIRMIFYSNSNCSNKCQNFVHLLTAFFSRKMD